MLRAVKFLLPLLMTGTALAHDFWLQPRSWQTAPGADLPFIVEVGHGSFRQQWGADASHLLVLDDNTKGARTDLRSLFKPGGEVPHLTYAFRQPGLHVVSLVSTDTPSALPSIRFNDYIAVEGLTPAIDERTRTRTTTNDGRELYSRRAKALIQVGPVTSQDNRLATKPLGLTLEIVPLRNPYALKADRILPVQVLYNGHPLSGALVKLTSLEFDVRPLEAARSDVLGRVALRIPPVGSWLVNVIWTRPIVSPNADFQTVFSSLTFGYVAKRPS